MRSADCGDSDMRDRRLDACQAALDEFTRRMDAWEKMADAAHPEDCRCDDCSSRRDRQDYDEDRELAYQNKSREEQRAVTTRGQQSAKEYAERMARQLQSQGKHGEARQYWRQAGYRTI